MNIDAMHTYETFYGNRVFRPAVIEPTGCGTTQQLSSSRAFFIAEDPLELSDRQLLLQSAIDEAARKRSQNSDISDIHIYSATIYPYTRAPQNIPTLYERDKLSEPARQKWIPRILMFEIAYRVRNIFTLSVVPKNPEICQTLYQKRLLSAPLAWLSPGCSSSSIKEGRCNIAQDNQAEPKKYTGFLKPFPTYTNSQYGIDPIFEKVEAVWLKSAEDIVGAVQGIEKAELKAGLTSILQNFLKDEEAESVGITFLNGQSYNIRLFHKSSYSII